MRKVLVADNSSITPFTIERMLGSEEYVFASVRYGRDVLPKMREFQPDILILEAEISGRDGEKICEFLHRQPDTKRIPILLITRLRDPQTQQVHLWPGVQALLRKPLSTDSLRETLSSLIFEDKNTQPGSISEAV